MRPNNEHAVASLVSPMNSLFRTNKSCLSTSQELKKFQWFGLKFFIHIKTYLMWRNCTSHILIYHIRDEHYQSLKTSILTQWPLSPGRPEQWTCRAVFSTVTDIYGVPTLFPSLFVKMQLPALTIIYQSLSLAPQLTSFTCSNVIYWGRGSFSEPISTFSNPNPIPIYGEGPTVSISTSVQIPNQTNSYLWGVLLCLNLHFLFKSNYHP